MLHASSTVNSQCLRAGSDVLPHTLFSSACNYSKILQQTKPLSPTERHPWESILWHPHCQLWTGSTLLTANSIPLAIRQLRRPRAGFRGLGGPGSTPRRTPGAVLPAGPRARLRAGGGRPRCCSSHPGRRAQSLDGCRDPGRGRPAGTTDSA